MPPPPPDTGPRAPVAPRATETGADGGPDAAGDRPGPVAAGGATTPGAVTGPSDRQALKAALRPYLGVIVVLSLILGILLVGLLIAVVGARQPSIVLTTTGVPTDQFSKDDGSRLTSTPAGQRWETTGRWGVVDGTALVLSPARTGPTTALLDLGRPDGRIAARLLGIDGLGGLVFRYQDDRNYATFVPAPAFGTWRLEVVQDGRSTMEKNIGLADATEGITAEVVVSGDTAYLFVANQLQTQVKLPAGLSGDKVGLISVPGPATKTRFDDVVAKRKGQV